MFNSQGSQIASSSANYIEDVFSTYLYTGNGSTQTITNGIDLAGDGGLTWIKYRDGTFGNGHYLYDTVRGAGKALQSNLTDAETATDDRLTSFNSNGFSLATTGGSAINASTYPYVSWTFRKQPKFFDVVTFTTTNSTNARIPHNLGSVPGFYVIKRVDGAGAWFAYHGSLGRSSWLQLGSTNAAASNPNCWGTTDPTSTDFGIDEQYFTNGTVGLSYVAYVFASNAGGFGLTGTDNVISCGSFTADNAGGGAYAGGATVNLGYEPQFVLLKETSSTDSDPNWIMVDTFRGYRAQETSGSDVGQQRLRANTSGAEANAGGCSFPTSTGFSALQLTGGATYIYIAIRRGPMKVPTVGTSVFAPVAQAGNGANDTITTGFTTDLVIGGSRVTGFTYQATVDRMRGRGVALSTGSTNADDASPTTRDLTSFASNTGYTLGYPPFATSYNYTGNNIYWNFKRAPSFCDVVCYTGTGSAMTVAHNLTVVPELMIVKRRNSTTYGEWFVYTAVLGNAKYQLLNTTQASTTANSGIWNLTTPTSTNISVGSDLSFSASTYVAYLFASCPGVSKVGSVTHVEPTTVVCGFIPRFIMIKSTTATGTDDWFVFDSARGLVPGNDPYLRLNSTGAENTPFGAADLVDVTSDGFIMNGFGGGNYIFLAIA